MNFEQKQTETGSIEIYDLSLKNSIADVWEIKDVSEGSFEERKKRQEYYADLFSNAYKFKKVLSMLYKSIDDEYDRDNYETIDFCMELIDLIEKELSVDDIKQIKSFGEYLHYDDLYEKK